MSRDHVVVVGVSAAGLTAAETLRREGFDGRLTLVDAEWRPPYDRPPLSKQILSGAWELERTHLRPPEDLQALDADWRLGVAATGLDAATRTVRLADGTEVSGDGLVLATGVTPRVLPFGHDLAGVHVLRTMDDAVALRAGLLAATSVVVVGAGFLGAEATAVASELGLPVSLVDPLPAPMIRQFGPVIGDLVGRLHTEHGVRVRTGVGVRALAASAGRVTGVELDDGTTLVADLVLVAIGARPATGWLAGSGLSLSDGVDCDERCLAAPGVVAAGDVASWTHPTLGTRTRVEHRMNATEQGAAAARTLLGTGTPFAPVSYFWTDQYDVRVQLHGHVPADADFAIVQGDPAQGRFAGLYGRQGRVVAALGWNMPKQARQLRAHVVAGTPWAEAMAQAS
jgi:3-phenylpropionate/trans-cinnamate dioxygenase ferredoxin reductase subunit